MPLCSAFLSSVHLECVTVEATNVCDACVWNMLSPGAGGKLGVAGGSGVHSGPLRILPVGFICSFVRWGILPAQEPKTRHYCHPVVQAFLAILGIVQFL